MLSEKMEEMINTEEIVVLILVLMEYALWDTTNLIKEIGSDVLILVLMEYALWASYIFVGKHEFLSCLNPCFNGICSLSMNIRNNLKDILLMS